MSDIITESEIKNSICALLERFPDRILFTVTPPKRTKYSSRYMKVGWPDISGCIRAQLVPDDKRVSFGTEVWGCVPFFIEVKKPGGALSIEQHKILERAKAMGAITCVACSVDDVRSALGL